MLTADSASQIAHWSMIWTAVGALATAFTVLVAIAAALVAFAQVRQVRELSEEQARPYLVASIESSVASPVLIDLVIRNVGQTAARRISVSLDPPFERARPIHGHPFMGLAWFKRPIETLAPGTSLSAALENLRDHAAKKDHPASYTISLKYHDRRGRALEDSFVLDLDQNVGGVYTEIYNVHHIAKTLRAWAKGQGINNF